MDSDVCPRLLTRAVPVRPFLGSVNPRQDRAGPHLCRAQAGSGAPRYARCAPVRQGSPIGSLGPNWLKGIFCLALKSWIT